MYKERTQRLLESDDLMPLPELPSNLTSAGIEAFLVWKVLGPPAEAMGGALSELMDYAAANVGSVFRNAAHKLGDSIERPGAVPPRALGKILDEAAYSDEQIVVEYLGGVLASSRTPLGTDDRGLAWTSLVGRLTRDQLRLHYLLYESLRRAMQGQGVNLALAGEATRKAMMFFPLREFPALMGLSLDDGDDWWEHFTEAVFGLHREGLLPDRFRYGPPNSLAPEFPGAAEEGVLWTPSVVGVRLFMWGHGRGFEPLEDFLDADANYSLEEPLAVAKGSGTVASLKGAATITTASQPTLPT
jgi:hypothetical protein